MDAQPETTSELPIREYPDGDYAIVECMGHSTLIGRCLEVERFGTKMLQIEPIFGGELLPPILQAGSSLYRFTPCTKEIAFKRGPTQLYALPDSIRATLPPTALPGPTPPIEVDWNQDDDERDEEQD